MENVMLENLKEGDILLVSAKRVNGNKISLEFAQRVKSPNSSNNILGLLNEGDERFNQAGGPRRAYLSAEVESIKKYFGVDCSDLQELGATKELNILNPKLNGQVLNLQITETSKGTEYEVANLEKTAKRAGKDGDFITTKQGEYIYVRTSVVTGEPRHTFITETERVSPSDNSVLEAMANA